MLKNMKVGKRLGGGFGILIVALVALISLGMVGTRVINDEFTHFVKIDNAKIQYATSIKDAVLEIEKGVLTILVTKDEMVKQEGMRRIEAARSAYRTALENLEKLEDDATGKEMLRKFKEGLAAGKKANDQCIELGKAGMTEEGASIYIAETKGPIGALTALCEEMVKHYTRSITSGYEKAQTSYHIISIILLAAGAIVVAFAVFTTYLLTRSITRPIYHSIKAARLLAAGNLGFEIRIDRTDEFGEEASAVKQMLGKWREIIGSVKQVSDSVASASVQLSTSAEQMSKGSGQQAERARQVAIASEEMSQTVEDVAQNASGLASTASTTASQAKEGGHIVEEAVKEVREIADTVEESTANITSLSDLSQRVGEIIGIINDIADQTNLLALNAAIEAARAGDHGRGFAVVADEVRKLAERTTGATSEVSDTLNQIETKVGHAVTSIERVSAKVERGVDLSNKAGNELRTIVGSVDELQHMIQQIATAIEEMSATSDRISKDIESISGISKETSDSSEEVSRSAQELSKLGANLQGVAQQFTI